MATVDGITVAKAQEIEDASVVSGTVNAGNGHLILSTAGGTQIDAGVVRDSSALNAHEADTSTHGVGLVVGTTETQTLSNKTLTTPAIASFINALHDHSNNANGGGLNLPFVLAKPLTSQNLSSGSPGPKTLATTAALTAGLWLVFCTARGFSSGTQGTNIRVLFFMDGSAGVDADWGGTLPQNVNGWEGSGDAEGYSLIGLFSTTTAQTLRLRATWQTGAATASTSTIGLLGAVRIGPAVTL